MRPTLSAFPLAASAAVAFFLVAAIVMIPDFAYAGDKPEETGRAQCTCPESKEQLWTRPKFAELKSSLDVNDEIAALETLQLALSEVGDGSAYVWHRYHGRLSGVVTPTTSFKDDDGHVCRHVVFVLTSAGRSQRSEGVACRLDNGQWQLQG